MNDHIRFLAPHEMIGFGGHPSRKWARKLGAPTQSTPTTPTLRESEITRDHAVCRACGGRVVRVPAVHTAPSYLQCRRCQREVAYVRPG